MKTIRPLKFSVSKLKFDCNSWTLLQSCNVLNPGEDIPLEAHHHLSKALYSDELPNHINLSSHENLDCGFPFVVPKHNTEPENTWTFVR